MAAPNGESPPGSLAVDAFAAWQAQTQDDALATISGGVRGGVGGARNVFGTEMAGYSDQIDGLRDGQLDLEDRTDLLEDVPGYAAAYMDRNWNVPGAGAVLPFNAQLGPNKNATLDGANRRIVFARKGLWRADAHISWRAAQSGWAATPAAIQLYLNVRYFDGSVSSLYSQRRYDIVVSTSGAETAAFSHTFVVPIDRTETAFYYADILAQHNKSSHWVYGGTLRSAFSVNRWGTGTDNASAPLTVPDGGSL